jgi:hypothetical protein
MIEVRLDDADYRAWIAATHKLEKRATFEWNDLPRKCAVDYYQEVTRWIYGQRNMGGYEEYDERYEKWKENFIGGRRNKFWELGGDLLRNLTAFRVTDDRQGYIAWMGGISSNVVDTGGKSWFGSPDDPKGPPKSIAMYGYVMEYGGTWAEAGEHPARPVFHPVAEYYAEGRWIRRIDETMRNLRKQWRK